MGNSLADTDHPHRRMTHKAKEKNPREQSQLPCHLMHKSPGMFEFSVNT